MRNDHSAWRTRSGEGLGTRLYTCVHCITFSPSGMLWAVELALISWGMMTSLNLCVFIDTGGYYYNHCIVLQNYITPHKVVIILPVLTFIAFAWVLCSKHALLFHKLTLSFHSLCKVHAE
jgi:hypothetical protein